MTDNPTPPAAPNAIEQWLFSVAAKKVSWGLGKVLAALGSSVVLQAILKKYGVSVDQSVFIPAATATIMAALEAGLDWLKLKTGWAWL